METKKSPKADLESKKTIFLQIGFIFALGAVFTAFEWSTPEIDLSQYEFTDPVVAEDDIIPLVKQEEKKPLPPPPQLKDIITVVDNDTELNEELEINDTELNQDDEIDFSNLLNEENEDEEDGIFISVEEMPEFPGGNNELLSFLSKSVKYPVIAIENRIQGRVYVYFVVDENGYVSDVRLIRGVDPAIDKEALRVVKSMPRWKPGKQRNKPVKVSFTVPINFVLE
ncbi:MAG: energy transducer TonB [Chlorobi bacterium]|nr:energy transducer TonB [Chlorobiota bacterium]